MAKHLLATVDNLVSALKEEWCLSSILMLGDCVGEILKLAVAVR